MMLSLNVCNPKTIKAILQRKNNQNMKASNYSIKIRSNKQKKLTRKTKQSKKVLPRQRRSKKKTRNLKIHDDRCTLIAKINCIKLYHQL